MLFSSTWRNNAQHYTNLLHNVVHQAIWQVWLATVGREIMNHPACSLVLASNDFNLFGPMNVHVRGQKFKTDELSCSVLNCLHKHDETYTDPQDGRPVFGTDQADSQGSICSWLCVWRTFVSVRTCSHRRYRSNFRMWHAFKYTTSTWTVMLLITRRHISSVIS
jgi:hypothetical protein